MLIFITEFEDGQTKLITSNSRQPEIMPAPARIRKRSGVVSQDQQPAPSLRDSPGERRSIWE